MKIERLRAYPDTFKLMIPFKTANVLNEELGLTHVTVETDEGITGYGEAYPALEVTGETQAGQVDILENHLFPTVSGAEINGLEDVKALVEAFDPGRRPQDFAFNPGAKAGLEMALLDLAAKGAGLPLCRLLAPETAPEKLRVPLTGAVGIMDTADGAVAIARFQHSNGIRRFKLKVGLDMGHDLEVIAALKGALPDVSLCLDANQGWVSWEGAARFFERLGPIDVEYVEQPVLADDYLGFVELKKRFPIKLMADESVHGFHQARTLIEMGAVDYLNMKLMKQGGILNCLAITEYAAERGVACQVGSMGENVIASAAGAHLFMSHDNLKNAELLGWYIFDRPMDKQLAGDDGWLVVPDAPGLGIDGAKLLSQV